MDNKHKLKSLIPLGAIEPSALLQIDIALQNDFLIKLAIMPDCHTGYLLPIGGVALLDGVVSPEYVGYDIGCGMCFFETNIPVEILRKKDLTNIFNKIYSEIPVGRGLHKKEQEYQTFKSAVKDKELDKKVNNVLNYQLGTLGSGNHFIEIGKNKKGNICITIHSGSRNPGHTIGGYYMDLTKKEDTYLPPGFLDANEELGKMYISDMNFMLQYALDNRLHMLRKVCEIMNISFNGKFVNENHNHAQLLNNGAIVHRKGATPAEEGQIGIIPGNMRDGVYITRGLGNVDYLSSASHGAGRKLSRRKAKEQLKLKDFEYMMKGIIAKVDKNTLDESPSAYKNLKDVIAMQEGIVIDTIDKVTPLISVKG